MRLGFGLLFKVARIVVHTTLLINACCTLQVLFEFLVMRRRLPLPTLATVLIFIPLFVITKRVYVNLLKYFLLTNNSHAQISVKISLRWYFFSTQEGTCLICLFTVHDARFIRNWIFSWLQIQYHQYLFQHSSAQRGTYHFYMQISSKHSMNFYINWSRRWYG